MYTKPIIKKNPETETNRTEPTSNGNRTDQSTSKPTIQKVVIADNDVKVSVSSFTHLMTGTVRIGSFASVASVWLPKVIKSFKRRYPEIRFEVLMGDFDEIEHWVKTGRVDFGFTSAGHRMICNEFL